MKKKKQQEESTTLSLRIEADLKDQLIDLAKEDDRNLNNYVVRIIKDHLES